MLVFQKDVEDLYLDLREKGNEKTKNPLFENIPHVKILIEHES